MNVKRRNFLALTTLVIVGATCFVSTFLISGRIEVFSSNSEYLINFNQTKNKIPAGSGTSVIQSELGNSFNVNYASLASFSSGWGLIKSGGYILTTKDESINNNAIRELTNITFSFPDASMFATMNIYVSHNGEFSSTAFKKYTVKHNSITFDLGGHTRYFKIESLSSNLYINEIKIKYQCGTESNDNSWCKSRGVLPSFSLDKTIVTYGLYPNLLITNSSLKNSLINQINERLDYSIGDFIWYNDDYYISAYDSNKNYVFFKCAKVQWNVVEKNDNVYLLNCLTVIDASLFGENSEYNNSTIRNYLINTVLKRLFFLYDDLILPIDEYNGDKIYLSTIDEYNSWYLTTAKKQKKITNYSSFKGVTSLSTKYGQYWSSTKNGENECYLVDTGGETSSTQDVKEISGIVPTIKIKIS